MFLTTDIPELQYLRDLGASMDAIAHRFLVCKATVYKVLRQCGHHIKSSEHHGLSRSKKKQYDRWGGILSRCSNPRHHAYKDYGGRGITVCERWRSSFSAFYEDTGDPPSGENWLDRIDNNAGYWCGKPECHECSMLGRRPNWRWSDTKTQAANRRPTHLVTHNGQTKTIAEWSSISGLPPRLIYNRFKLSGGRNLLKPKGKPKETFSLYAQTRRIWYGMVQRCTNPKCKNYVNYGAKGIDVSESWRTFSNFLSDMGERPSPEYSIDRIDNTKGYSVDNVRWATREEQQCNRRPRGKSGTSVVGIFQSVMDV